MNDPGFLILAFLAGLVLGAVFFGGLLWTVRRALPSKSPAAWFLSSLLLRMAIALLGLYFVSRGDWRRMAACLVGFVSARVLLTRLVGSAAQGRAASAKGSRP
jgi:F1F0 ATPase subunit 2